LRAAWTKEKIKTIDKNKNFIYFLEMIREKIMQRIFLFFIACLSIISCGKRGALEPYEKENASYPRQYPYSEIQKQFIREYTKN
jgi:hypothetical protein